jgi:hypothetical protein
MSDYCELAEFYECRELVARKDHTCCECHSPIATGEKHLYAVGKWAGDFDYFRQHLICGEACMLIRDKFNGGDCIPFGALFDEFHEFRGDYAEEQHREAWQMLRNLMAKIKWRKRQERIKKGQHP